MVGQWRAVGFPLSAYRRAGRVQAPLAPGFYRSCADALTDGFRPQSGLVQRECYIATDVVVLPMAAKAIQPRLRRVGNAPLLPPAAASPPKGEILAVLYFAMLMRPKAGRNYKIHRPKGDTFPFEPFEPSEPSEPGAAEPPPLL